MDAERTIEPAADWSPYGEWSDIRYETDDGIAKITIDRPEVRNAFRPLTISELIERSSSPATTPSIGVDHPHRAGARGVLFRRRPEDPRRRRLRRRATASAGSTFSTCRSRSGGCPSPWWRWWPAMRSAAATCCTSCCDLTIAADNARFGQTGPKVGSFDGGYGINLLARQIGEKRAKEVWFLCRQYDAETALDWGLVNTVVPLDELERDDRRVVPRDAGDLPARPAPAEGRLQRRHRRARRACSSSPATRRSSTT